MVHKYTRVQKNRRVYRGGEHTYYVVYYVYTLDWRRHLPNCRVQTKLCDPNQCKKPTKHIEFRRVSQMRKSKLNYSIAHWTWLLSKTKKAWNPFFTQENREKERKNFISFMFATRRSTLRDSLAHQINIFNFFMLMLCKEEKEEDDEKF